MRWSFFIMLFLFSVTVSAAQSSADHNTKPKLRGPAVTVKIHLPRSLKPIILGQADDDDDSDDDLDLQVAYRRPDLVDNSELPLSDYVRLRLAHARRLALSKYQEIWG
jgi:hypothetical protein